MTLDEDGVGVGELDLDVLLFYARKLAVKVEGLLCFLDIEARLEGRCMLLSSMLTSGTLELR